MLDHFVEEVEEAFKPLPLHGRIIKLLGTHSSAILNKVSIFSSCLFLIFAYEKVNGITARSNVYMAVD